MNSFAMLATRRTVPQWSRWRRLFAFGAVVVAMMAVSAGARTQYVSSDSLYTDCTSAALPQEKLLCGGYVAAVADAALSISGTGVYSSTYCPTLWISLQQAIDIVVRFLAVHSELRGFPAPIAAARALSEAFPYSK